MRLILGRRLEGLSGCPGVSRFCESKSKMVTASSRTFALRARIRRRSTRFFWPRVCLVHEIHSRFSIRDGNEFLCDYADHLLSADAFQELSILVCYRFLFAVCVGGMV